jgi:ATP-dependent DNA helicase RecQ
MEAVADPMTLARKILSAVARVGQRFGAAHVTNVLRGSESEAVITRGHAGLSVFGLLRDATIDEVRGYIDQLVAWELLRQAGDQFPVLMLTAEGVALIKDPGAMPGLTPRTAAQACEKASHRSARRIEAGSWEGVDRDLFESLRSLRLKIARDRSVPPYVVFHDTTLRELARVKPRRKDQLSHIYGIGARKAEDLGDVILEAIRAHAAASPSRGRIATGNGT